MNPNDFPWSEDQQVTVTNPTAENFKFKVHNKEYQLGAGKTARMPGYIAWMYVYGMACQLAQANGEFNRWNEEGFRQTYFEKVYTGVDALVEEIVVEAEPEIETFDEEETVADLPDEPSEDEFDEPVAAATASKVQPMKPGKTSGRTSRA